MTEQTQARIGDFEDDRIIMLTEAKQFEDDPRIQTCFDGATKIADLGSGAKGASTKQLLYLCPKTKEVDTVDMHFDTILEIGDDIKHVHHKIKITKFLEEARQQNFDVLSLAHVPDHNLQAQDYQNLGRILKVGGVVIEVGDTALDEQEMRKYFELKLDVGAKPPPNPEYYRIWMKK